ncbi:hypothetical protein C1H46_032008 [Malus baccata]|uniref:Uncharacterized protein n=1 Tax=Malus baccata TaxID=106549 RepID=A0A540L7J8_MALBA|nr:hypothetical protein C1H46_032008 [Malus baccata]
MEEGIISRRCHVVDTFDFSTILHQDPSTSSDIGKEKHYRHCVFAVINILQPVMPNGDSFQDMAMSLALPYRCTNSSKPLQYVRAAQMRQKSAVATTCGVEMVAAASF